MAGTPPSSTTTDEAAAATGGGFIAPRAPRTALPSPSPSTASSRAAAGLPHPRSKPLQPGSRKEDYARDYVSRRLMHVSRRYVKKHGIPDPADEVTGYEDVSEMCSDLDEIVDVLWFSGTPSIQVPYLLNVALAFREYLPSFTPQPRPTFSLLRKLDHCFASLLVGHDVKSGQPLPGFATTGYARPGFSRTDMVRIKSLADETRMQVAVVMSGEAEVEDDPDAARVEVVEERVAELSEPGRPTAMRRAGELPRTDLSGDRGQIQRIAGTGDGSRPLIKEEEDKTDEEDDDDNDFVDVPAPSAPSGPGKRKVEDDADLPSNDSYSGLDAEMKRIKVEDADAEPMVEEMSSPPPRPAPPSAPNKRHLEDTDMEGTHEAKIPTNDGGNDENKFQWSIDTDSEGSDSEEPTTAQGNGNNNNTGDTNQVSVPPPPSTSTTERPQQLSPPAARAGADGGGFGHYSDDDGVDDDDESDEEEELHLNVAKVYIKTLVQLGKTLGESIIDE